MAFPATLPSYTITSGAESPGSAAGGLGISGLLNAFEADITALGTKLGTGASTPTANTVLFGTGVGTSAWQGLTSAQMASIVSDETGSGSLVFANSPTIATPTISSPVLSGTTTGTYTLAGTPTITSPIINQFSTSSGLGAAWSTWTPTWSTITVGNGTVVANYTQIGKTVTCYLKFVMGSTSTMGASSTFTLPVTANSKYSVLRHAVGTVYFEDSGTAAYYGITEISVGVAQVHSIGVGATYASDGGLGAAVPFAWGTNDYFATTFTYEAA